MRNAERTSLLISILVWTSGICALGADNASGNSAIPSRYSSYEKLTIKQLNVMPEEYDNDRIYVEGIFTNFSTTFPNYFERSGFKSSKYFALMLAGSSLPVLLEKNDDTNQLIASLKRGAKVRVIGRLKDFKYEPKHRPYPHYYIECKVLQVLANETKKRPNQPNLGTRRPGKGFFRK